MRKLYFCLLTAGILSCGSVVFPQTVIQLYNDSVYQTIEGFGGFGPAKVWWSSPPFYDATYLQKIIDELGCTIIRTQIYWDGEPVNDNNDPNVFNWNGFNFGSNTDNGKQFPFIRDLGAKGAKLMATVWTPPIWMKGLEEFYGTYNGNPVRRRPSADQLNSQCSWCGGASGCQQVGGRLKQEYYAEFAEYLAAYVLKVKAETGVDVWAINIQNEPMFPNPFESCVVIPSEYADILKTVGEKFQREGISTRLFGPEHMGEWSWGNNRDYVNEILGDPAVRPYLSFFAVHSYVDGVTPDYGSADGWSKLYYNITAKYSIPLWMTETSDDSKTGFDLGFSMAKSLHLALRFGRISGWVYWYMADVIIKNNVLQPIGYAFMNYYRYVRPGYVQIKSTSPDASLLVTAFKQATNYTVVIINNSSTTKTISLNLNQGTLPSSFDVYRTSASENCLKVGTVTNNSFTLPGNSITTLCHGIPITDTQAPSVPSGLKASAITSTSFTLSWNASTDNIGVVAYEVYRNGTLVNANVSGTSLAISGLSPATTYQFTVKARDAAGNISAASTPLSVTTLNATDTQAPTAPTSLAATQVTSSSVTLTWKASTDNVGVTGYSIYQNNVLVKTVTGTTVTLTGLSPNTAYIFTVKAKDAAGNLSAGASVAVRTSSSTVLNNNNGEDVVVYPNPVTGREITIQTNLSGLQQYKIELLDMKGSPLLNVSTMSDGQITLSVPAHLHGLYLLKICSTEWQVVKKIIIE